MRLYLMITLSSALAAAACSSGDSASASQKGEQLSCAFQVKTTYTCDPNVGTESSTTGFVEQCLEGVSRCDLTTYQDCLSGCCVTVEYQNVTALHGTCEGYPSEAVYPQPGPTECTGTTDASAVCGIWSFVDTTCDACFQQHCCSCGMACAPGSDCEAFDACVVDCDLTDNACARQCQMSHPTGFTAWTSAYGCYDRECATSCQ